MRTWTRIAIAACGISAISFALAPGCSSDTSGDTGSSGTTTESGTGTGTATGGASGSGGAGTGGTTTTGSAGSTGSGMCMQTACLGHIYQCGDCVDNDGDGKIDSDDPDCLGPCDNTEDSYYGGIPGQAGEPCNVDCYFDSDSGSGNDGCYWSHICDMLDVAPNYYPEAPQGATCQYNANFMVPGSGKNCNQLYTMQSQQCLDYCGPLTPNGCDCFGCCELPAGSGKYVWLGSDNDGVQSNGGTCTLDVVSDPTKCQPCTPVQACLNTCAHCELCLGKTTLPSDCYPDAGTTGSGGGSTTGQCSAGVQACGLAGEAPCAAGYYCITGCCQPIPK